MFYKVDELAHYGIKGQKWGLRRFQNEDGTYTEAGKQRYELAGSRIPRKEVKYDNRSAFGRGKISTVTDRARDMSDRKLYKLSQKLDKVARSDKQKRIDKLKKRLEIEKETTNRLEQMSDEAKKEMIRHRDYLLNKYGNKKLKDIKEKEVVTPLKGAHKDTNERIGGFKINGKNRKASQMRKAVRRNAKKDYKAQIRMERQLERSKSNGN